MRIDGKAFHTWTRGLKRPFDQDFQALMDNTAKIFCSKVQGAICAYTQSDEVSLLLVDFDPEGKKLTTSSWFDGNVQKLCSVGASTFTAIFNDLVPDLLKDTDQLLREREPAVFDTRVFTIPDPVEIYNYFVWRQQDATRNSIQAAALHYYSDKECFGKKCSDLQEMIFQAGQNWNDYPVRFKRGGFIHYDETVIPGFAVNKKTGNEVTFERPIGWSIFPEIPVLTSQEGRAWFFSLIPKLPELSYKDDEGEA
jgi:tRNA(His) 5'-end guanylyltransferase